LPVGSAVGAGNWQGMRKLNFGNDCGRLRWVSRKSSDPQCKLNFPRTPCGLISVSQMHGYWQVDACLRAAQKTATYRSPRFYQLAALVPSAGTHF
jgi:hypothetical protein